MRRASCGEEEEVSKAQEQHVTHAIISSCKSHEHIRKKYLKPVTDLTMSPDTQTRTRRTVPSFFFMIPLIAFVLPYALYAQEPDLTYLTTGTREIGSVVALLIPFVVAIALLLFFWGLATFILAAGEDEGRRKGRQRMIWGVIALFVIISVWGIVAIIRQVTGTAGAPELAVPPGIGNLPQ
jgi:hypothetical protein